jgi:hypothetical protein
LPLELYRTIPNLEKDNSTELSETILFLLVKAFLNIFVYLSMSSSPLAPMADIRTCWEKRKLQNVELKQEKFEYSPGDNNFCFTTFIIMYSSYYPLLM